MAKGDVTVRCAGLECYAAGWWLRERYIPFAVERWRATKEGLRARDIAQANKLADRFARAAERQCPDRLASRKIPRAAAWWLGVMPDAIAVGDAPAVLPRGVDSLPSADVLMALPAAAARELLLGAGALEVMLACRATMRGYLDGHRASRRGPARQPLTLEGVEEAAARAQGFDKRHWERRRAQAKRDEAQIDAERSLKLGQLWTRVPDLFL